MMIVTISSGAHWRNLDVPSDADQYAHIFDPESPEDVPHDAHNFITYAVALGLPDAAIILLRPEDEWPDWAAPVEEHSARHFGPEDDHIEVMMSDWKAIVESATGRQVEIR
jgi:hypothetical protein